MRKIFFLFFPLFLALSFFINTFFVKNVSADESGGSDKVINIINQQFSAATNVAGLSTQDPRQTVANLIKVFLGIVGIIFLGLIVYAGFLWMTSAGESKKVEEAQKYLKNGVIGLVIVLAAYGIVLLITLFLLRSTTYAPETAASDILPAETQSFYK
ncbi:MAG: hypothetical protein UT86_C0004G0090 [Candidatus Magasanikbacteria bacterium GW2011_GWC2_40_17]|uniref:Uncharacterized protein n=1 Tax=Candidatus Magasanikbacteria bacterium GW2011_GWA2_42_32 TaxID=1619039 RepID=A0A0G1D557_9BACT|nr:MAG: hypothetical protein UT86_C0004G0090 [Candidatus Magasanikbacteria bacterium GW2011_GWC2_40_17]KKS57148.1 MAG: hypothetical protein UV20_C0003G0090 [Candidatus Magasanikbacteria bacterium GW2011_GWA2_42_32]OGH85331.1 MAG: hypothetical protein A2294_00995 [Candidatus Magasanikbacteria bacterium RIFOXYB2_FULL_38_10]